MEKKIVGLNTYFKSLEYENFDEYEFSARISLLDYDAVVINAEYLITNYSTSYDSSYQNNGNPADFSVVYRGRQWRIEDCKYAQ